MTKPHIRWFDDWYAIEAIAPGLFGIGEPKYHQVNWNYLIVGQERALLFDTGPGLRDITPVVASLTDRPVTTLLSHLHFDHTGNFHRFADRALPDLAILRACVRDGVLVAPEELFFGSLEDMVWVPVDIGHWWPIGHRIDLGGRSLEIIATPGHSPESISLYDAGGKILLAADFLYLGSLYAQIPGAFLPDYLLSAEALARRLPEDVLILGAHGKPLPDGTQVAPRLFRGDLADLVTGLKAIRDGNMPPMGQNPDRYWINGRLMLLAGPESYGSWRSEQGG
ncbi:MBL fold metallo-hydrolase [Taklimakanibacter deserti]|uniref:MBL fold metallo-hydrolase n=1 Tax=Taklimakanibacter deserti TaxID=2267839 RepID=UPI000E64DC5B